MAEFHSAFVRKDQIRRKQKREDFNYKRLMLNG